MVDTTKIGVLEALKDSGLTKGMAGQGGQTADKGPSKSISFKDLPRTASSACGSGGDTTYTPTDDKNRWMIRPCNGNQKGKYCERKIYPLTYLF